MTISVLRPQDYFNLIQKYNEVPHIKHWPIILRQPYSLQIILSLQREINTYPLTLVAWELNVEMLRL